MLAGSKTTQIVTEIVRPVIEDLGLRLWDVRFLKEGASWYLRVFIDSDNGIDINNCTDVSHAIDPLIDEADPIKVPYYLEVCSPGINRELKTDEHFEVCQGKPILVHTVREENGCRDFKGTLLSRSREEVIINTENGEIKIQRSNIGKVTLDDEKIILEENVK